MFSDIISKIRKKKDEVTQKFKPVTQAVQQVRNDFQFNPRPGGFVGFTGPTAQFIKSPIMQKVGQDTVKQTAKNYQTFKNIPIIGDIGGAIGDSMLRAQKSNMDFMNPKKTPVMLSRQGIGAYGRALTDSTVAGANVLGAGRLKAGLVGGNMVFGAGANMLFGDKTQSIGKRAWEGARAGAKSTPGIAGVGALSNPMIASALKKTPIKAGAPVANFISRGLAGGAMNVPEGMAMQKAINPDAKYGLLDAGLDFGLGFATGGRQVNKALSINKARIVPKIGDIYKGYRVLANYKRVSELDSPSGKIDLDKYGQAQQELETMNKVYGIVDSKEWKKLSELDKVQKIENYLADQYRYMHETGDGFSMGFHGGKGSQQPNQKLVNVQNPDGTLRQVPEAQVKPRDVVVETLDIQPPKIKVKAPVLNQSAEPPIKPPTPPQQQDPFLKGLEQDQVRMDQEIKRQEKAEANQRVWKAQTGVTPDIGGGGKPPDKPPELLNQEDFAQEAGRVMESAEANKKAFDGIFAKWVGKREASGTTALQKAEQFRNIPQDKATKVIDAIEYPNEKVDGEVSQYVKKFKTEYDVLFKEAKDAGVDIGYLKNYITHIWDKPIDEVKQMYKSLSTKFQFAKEREVPTYREGIEMGLVPKYTQPSQILAAYVDNLEKVKANLELIKELKKNDLIVNAATARSFPGNFVPLNGVGFPQSKTFNAEGTTIGSYYAPKEIADVINRVFDEQNTGIFDKTAKVSSFIQDITMSGGLPKTPLNAWTIAQMTKEMTAGRLISPVSAFFRSISGKASDNYFRANLGQIKKMQEQNIPVQTTVDVDSFLDKGTISNMFGGNIPEAWNKAMNEPTFKRFMPQLQIQFFNDIEKQALKAGRSPQEAAQIAGKAVKNFYGVTGSDTLAKRSKLTQDTVGTFLFAPRYRESMINFWVNNIKALSPVKVEDGKVRINNPLSLENRNNTKFMVGGLLTLIAMNKMNEATMGQPMSENGPGKEDKLLIPLEDGTVLGIPFMSSIATMPRMAYRMGMSGKEGDFAQVAREGRGLLSMGIKPLADVVANENYFGQEIVGENDTPEERFQKQGQHLLESYNHPYMKALTGQGAFGGEKEPLYQSISKGVEAPIRFYSQKNIDASKYYEVRKQAMKGLNDQELKAFENIPKSEGDPLNSMYKYQTYTRYPKTFEVQREIALRTAEKTKDTNIDPLYLIPDELVKRYIASASLAPGDPEKSDMYKAFPQLAEFAALRSEYFDANPLPEQEGENINATRPQPTEYIQAQMDAKNWKDPQVQAYLIAKDDWNNSQRDRLGLLPVGEPGSWGYGGGRGGFKAKAVKKIPLAKGFKPNVTKIDVASAVRPVKIQMGSSKRRSVPSARNIQKRIKLLQKVSKPVTINQGR